MDRTSKRIVSLCDGCALPDVMTGTCTAFVDPEWQWRNYDPETGKGACWGRCMSAEQMVERLEGIVRESEKRGPYAYGLAKAKKELDDWKRIAALAEKDKQNSRRKAAG